ncbi:MAG: hypothetical protein Q9170_004680 [Blastenia crenularia]
MTKPELTEWRLAQFEGRLGVFVALKRKSKRMELRWQTNAYSPQWGAPKFHLPTLGPTRLLLQTPKPADGDEMTAHVFELTGEHLVECQNDGTPASFSRTLDSESPNSPLRVVVVGHGNSWDVDRDILDVLCSKYNIDPHFLARHLDYPTVWYEKHCPRDLCHGVEKADRDYYKKKYSWDLGGDVMSHLSLPPGSCFFFAYRAYSMSVAVHQEDLKVTLLLLLRAPQKELLATSRIFFCYPGAGATRSTLLATRPPATMHELLIRSISELEVLPNQQQSDWIAKVVLPYIINLAGCCNADYHRNIAPRALKNLDIYRTDADSLLDLIRQLVSLRQEVKSFLGRFHCERADSDCTTCRGHETCRLLSQLTDDSQRLLSFSHADQRSSESDYLGKLMEAQVDEAKEAKATSAKLGRLSQLAYIFLPLQLTASAMGMNLKEFGTGNIELRTFLTMFAIIATLSFVPMLYPLVAAVIGTRLSQIFSVMEHSPRAGFLFGWFCIFHRHTTNNKVFKSGIEWVLIVFQGLRTKRKTGAPGWGHLRQEITTLLNSGRFQLFPRYWQGVLDEIYGIIDSPQWGKKDPSLHTA